MNTSQAVQGQKFNNHDHECTYSSFASSEKKVCHAFQMTEPLVHMLNEKQVELLLEFLACFVKPEVIVAQKPPPQTTS